MSELLVGEVESILSEELEVFGSLIDCLKKEREAVILFDLNALAESYKLKHENLLRIEVLETSRRGLIKKSEASLQEVLDLQEGSSPQQVARVRHLLSCLKSMSQAAQEFNENQKKYLVHSLSDVQSTLSLIEIAQGKGRFHGYDENGLLAQDNRGPSGTMSGSV